jgi:hypothetical protein
MHLCLRDERRGGEGRERRVRDNYKQKHGLTNNHRLVMRDIELARKEHKRVHPKVVFVQDLPRKTSVIGRIKVERSRLDRVKGGRDSFRSTCFQTFFLPKLFFPRARVKRGEFLKRNPARKKRGRGQGRSPNTNFQQVDG